MRITSKPGETFIDRMIGLVEGASRQKTPNEVALNVLLASLTLIFVMAVVTLQPMAYYSGAPQDLIILVALIVALIPTTIGALLSAIGIAGMDRLVQRNVLAMSGRAVEAAGDVNTLLLDKTGTITMGDRQATEFLPVSGVDVATLADAAQLASLADETPEGRSIVVLAKNQFNIRERGPGELPGAVFVPFTAQTRMSGVDLADGREVRKGAAASVAQWIRDNGGTPPDELGQMVDDISAVGGTPLVVAEKAANGTARALGVVYLKDIVKEGIAERFAEMRAMGIRTVMITGDNPRTARAIAEESGVDDFLAEATPEDKMALIRKEQEGGKLVAMTGDGTNDAPALAQADVGVAMNTGTSAAKEAGNMVDLDSNPTKLIEVVEIGKQLLITRGALTTFSIANDVAKYFAMLPAMFSIAFPELSKLNILHLHSPQSAIASAIIFNALIIIALIPLALRGVRYKPSSASAHAPQEPADLRRRRPDHPVHIHQGDRPHHHEHPRIQVIHVNRLPTLVRQHIAAFRALLVFTVLCGIIYPVVMVGVAQVAFKNQADGSLVTYNGKVVGSSLLVPGVRGREGQPAAAVLPAAAVQRVQLVGEERLRLRRELLRCRQPRPEQHDPAQDRPAAAAADRGVRPREGLADPAGRGHLVGVRPRPGHLAAVRGHPGPPGRRGAAPAGVASPGAGQQVHPGPEHRLPRRAAGECAQPEHRP